MSDEMKLLIAICEAIGLKVDIKKEPVFGNQYTVTKRADEVGLINDTFNNMFGDVKTELSSLSVLDYIDYQVMFKSFLKEHNAYAKFIDLLHVYGLTWMEVIKGDPEQYIISWFAWVDEDKFWSNLNNEWLAQLKTIKGE